MSEGTSDKISEAELESRVHATKKEPISQEILEEFSKGEVRVTDRAFIKGEEDERKLQIRVRWNDPAIVASKTNETPKKIIELSRIQEDFQFKTELTNHGLDAMNVDKQMFEREIFNRYALQPLKEIGDGILKKYRKSQKNRPEKAEAKEELRSQLKRLNNLRRYLLYLRERNALVITTEERPKNLLGLIRNPFLKASSK